MYLILIGHRNSEKEGLDESAIIELLNKHCSRIDLRRFDDVNELTEISFNVEFNDFKSIIDAKNDLKKMGNIQFSFIENY